MKSKHQERVEKFMILAGQEIPKSPVLPSVEIRQLRATIILEEALETIKGLGCSVYHSEDRHYDYDLTEVALKVHPYGHQPNLEEVADGCWDLRVVTTGCLSACGIHDEEGQEEVDNNNLAKFKIPECSEHGEMSHIANGKYECGICNQNGFGGYRRDDGKFVKPSNHPKPKIKEIINSQIVDIQK